MFTQSDKEKPMYTLYYLQGACSLATQVVLHELNQEVKIIDKNNVEHYSGINPLGAVPMLVVGTKVMTEGAAIMLYLLTKHQNSMLPIEASAKQKAIENIMFANATMHPAYSKLFFIAQNIKSDNAKHQAFEAAAKAINSLWQVVESKLKNHMYLGNEHVSAADIMLAVYSTWGAHFPVDITLGTQTSKMIDAVKSLPSFRKAVAAENIASV